LSAGALIRPTRSNKTRFSPSHSHEPAASPYPDRCPLCLLRAPAAALRSIGPVTKQEAGELGIIVRATAAGPEAAWVTLEFTPGGKLKDYSHVELEVEEGGKPLIAYAVLGEKRGPNGSVSLTFMVSRAFLPKVTLSIVTGFPSNYAGNQLALRDFVNVAEIR
jgi:hypothetical protein